MPTPSVIIIAEYTGITLQNGNMVVYEVAPPGTMYQFVASDSLNPASWTPVAVKQADSTGQATFVDTDWKQHPMRFYATHLVTSPIPPAPVADVQAATLSSTHVWLTWLNNSDNADSVTVEYSPSPSGPFQGAYPPAPGDATFYDAPGLANLSPLTQYYFRVKQSNATGDSPYSSVVSSMTAASSIASNPGGTDLQISPDTARASLTSALSYNPDGITLFAARAGHTATVLPNNKVFVFGGGNLIPVEVYDPSGNSGQGASTRLTGTPRVYRTNHTATLLPNGKVLLIGGLRNNLPSATNLVELYDPAGNNGAGLSTLMGSLLAARASHTATLLPSGKILVVGGHNNTLTPTVVELYDPTGTGSTQNPGLTLPVSFHTATLLASGKVLIVGGQPDQTLPRASGLVYLFDPAGNGGLGSLTPMANLGIARYNHTATLLSDGTVLLIGGNTGIPGTSAEPEIYNPNGTTLGMPGATRLLSYDLGTPRYGHTASLLNDGRTLIIGGVDVTSASQTSAVEFYDHRQNAGQGGTVPFGDLNAPVKGHASVTLPDGRVWTCGGSSPTGNVNTWATYSKWSPVFLSVSGGTPPYTFSTLTGAGTMSYPDLFVPAAAGSIRLRATDGGGLFVESVILAQ